MVIILGLKFTRSHMETGRLEANSLEDEIWPLGSGETFHTNDNMRP